jgi:GDP-4-dehydro-6-deoxy-D-mannose reductase
VKTILVTGAGGFVGKHLVRELKGSGELILTDAKKSRGIISLDITKAGMVDKAINKYRPDEIYHLAAIATQNYPDKKAFKKVNVAGTLNILKACKKHTLEAKILLVSTGYVYGQCNRPATEKTSPNPIGEYAISKIEMEQLAGQKFPDLNIYIARPFNHAGSGQPLGMLFPDLAQRARDYKTGKIKDFTIYNPSDKRDFLHVKDVCRAYKTILKSGKPWEVYNICSGRAYTMRELAQAMIKAAKIKKPKIVTSSRPTHVTILAGTNRKIKSLGWRARLSIETIAQDALTRQDLNQ